MKVCVCHGEPMKLHGNDGKYRCAVKIRERQKNYARQQRASSVTYRVTQRRGRLRRLRAEALVELSQLRQEGHEWRSAATPATNAN